MIKKINIQKVTNYYIELLNNENKKNYMINYLYNIVKDMNCYNIKYILESIDSYENFNFNQSISNNKNALSLVSYVYERLKNKYLKSTAPDYKKIAEENLNKYTNMISLKNWNQVMLEIETKNG